MFKMSTVVAALFVAALMGPACSSSGLKSRAGDAGAASGGQAGSAISSGTTGGSGGTSGPGGISTSATDGGAIGPGGAGGANIGGTGGTASPGGAGTGGTGGTIIGPGGSGGASTGRTGGLASSATSSGGGGNTGGISSGGQANTGGSAGAGGMSSSGGANGTAGAAGSDSTQTSLDASVSADVSADVQVFSQCSLGIVFAGLVCSTGPWGSYSGKLIAAAPIDTGGDPEFASCVSSSNGSLQYSFTLALGDGGTTRIGYGSESASALMPLPSLAAWVGKSVNVAVTPYNEGYASGGSFLTVTDSASLVLAVNTEWILGLDDLMASQTVGAPGITVTPDAPICVGDCNQLEGGFVFSGTSAVSLAPGGVGSFKLGDMTFTAYAGLWHGGLGRPLTCVDFSNSTSWAIFRNGI